MCWDWEPCQICLILLKGMLIVLCWDLVSRTARMLFAKKQMINV